MIKAVVSYLCPGGLRARGVVGVPRGLLATLPHLLNFVLLLNLFIFPVQDVSKSPLHFVLHVALVCKSVLYQGLLFGCLFGVCSLNQIWPLNLRYEKAYFCSESPLLTYVLLTSPDTSLLRNPSLLVSYFWRASSTLSVGLSAVVEVAEESNVDEDEDASELVISSSSFFLLFDDLFLFGVWK